MKVGELRERLAGQDADSLAVVLMVLVDEDRNPEPIVCNITDVVGLDDRDVPTVALLAAST
jgi:hypothetical protein